MVDNGQRSKMPGRTTQPPVPATKFIDGYGSLMVSCAWFVQNCLMVNQWLIHYQWYEHVEYNYCFLLIVTLITFLNRKQLAVKT